jgi:hypothetical protein
MLPASDRWPMPAGSRGGRVHDRLVPDTGRIFSWIEQVCAQGVRRPGYPADRWAETWAAEQFRSFGLESVRAEPVELASWEPRQASLSVRGDAGSLEIPGFALPHCAPMAVEAQLVAYNREEPSRVRGAISLYDVPLIRVPYSWYASIATWTYDPRGTFDGAAQVLPFGREMMAVMEPSIEAGALGFVGTLSAYPGNSRDYFVPYDAECRPVPGVWVSDSDGQRLRSLLEGGRFEARLEVDALRETITSYNIIGELPGADDECVIVGSHHDGPWSSAVEDASGIAMVMAQAAYWSRVPANERPHRLLFLLNCGHMAGGAGQAAFVEQHRSELDQAVLEVHLEHAAAEVRERDGALHATGEPEARWWFTSRINRLEAAVRAAIEAEGLDRSFVLRPDSFGPKPTTDAADFHLAGVPLVNYLVAPFYLFDAMDTLDKIHKPSLEPVTRAAIRIIASTAGVSARAMRADVV